MKGIVKVGENVNNSLHISHYQMIREETTGHLVTVPLLSRQSF